MKKNQFMLLGVICLLVLNMLFNPVPAFAATKISKCNINLSKQNYDFTGSACKPKVTVTYKNKTLKSGKDYTVKYENNVYSGAASVIIKGKGKFSGTETRYFDINNKLTITLKNTSYKYTGSAIKPKVTVKKGKKKLSASNYKVTYKKNKNAGTAYVIVKGTGKYKGMNASASFKIEQVSSNEDSITVQKNVVTYSVATDGNTNGSLQAGQNADQILSDFPAMDGAMGLNHPNGIASDGKHFVVCDTWNNRVLVYNSLPDKNVNPDVVIGQNDLTSFIAGDGLNQLNWPVGVTFAGEKLIIADTHNNRLLVYNTVPTASGAMADAVITHMSESDDLVWPWAVWSDGTKLIVTSTRNGKVAFWDDVNTGVSGGYADKLIDTKGTPRTIISDGNFILIGDHNINGGGNSGSHIWKKYPASNNSTPDFSINMQYGGGLIDGNLYGLNNDSNFYVYNGIIDNASENPVSTFGNIEGYMQAGDYNQIVYAGGKTYASYYNSSIVAIYNGKLTKDNYASPIGYLGAASKIKSASVERGIYQNPIPASDGKSLVLVDDYNRLLAVYKNIPNTNNVRADVEYQFSSVWDYPIDVVIDSAGKMYVLTAKSVLVWNKVPLNGEMYDYKMDFDKDIGKQSSRLAVDDANLYIYSEVDSKIFKISKSANKYSFANALAVAMVPRIRGLNYSEGYLYYTNDTQGRVTVLNADNLSPVGEVYSTIMERHFNLVADALVLPNKQFVTVDNDVMRVWNTLEDAIADREFTRCVEIGRNDNYSLSYMNSGRPQSELIQLKSAGSLFTPTYLTYANGHLWVGEYKFSSRLVRYDLK